MSKPDRSARPKQSEEASPSRREQAPRKPRRPMPAAIDIGNGEDPRRALGRIVHRERIKIGLSQEDLADLVGLDRTYISGIERGIRNPTLLVMLRLSRALQVSPGTLVEFI